MAVVDHRAEAQRAFETMQSGGVAIVPNDVGYAAMATHHDALKRIFDTKGRASSKLNAMVGHQRLHERLHRARRGRARSSRRSRRTTTCRSA